MKLIAVAGGARHANECARSSISGADAGFDVNCDECLRQVIAVVARLLSRVAWREDALLTATPERTTIRATRRNQSLRIVYELSVVIVLQLVL